MTQILIMVAQRLALGLLTLFAVSLIIFLGVELLPGDITQALLGQGATPETVAAFRRELGLDLPPHVRYVRVARRHVAGRLRPVPRQQA